jgi:UDP:flavonoid glycosyltransferase YjiC (YdhE family)
MLGYPRKLLFFPLSNVLGHLTRTMALAEEFDAQGHEVFIATDQTYTCLTNVLPRTIRILPTPEMYHEAVQSFGMIRHYKETVAKDRENLEGCGRIDESELRRRRELMTQMVERDSAIVEKVSPDAIITDYRFTTQLIEHHRPQRVFHISHIVGYPSLYRRVTGRNFVPLHSGHILVPGVSNIEYWKRSATIETPKRRETMCGPFRWRGWERLNSTERAPEPSDVFLCFGSTGNGGHIVPYFLQKIPERYRISAVTSEINDSSIRDGVTVANHGDLSRYLDGADVVFCHGGHGTVMECIFHQTPMVIFPHNIEQLEIGRRIEKMGLGAVVKQPYDQLSGEEIGMLIEKVRSNSRIKANIAKYSKMLRKHDGPKVAVSTVIECLSDGDVKKSQSSSRST